MKKTQKSSRIPNYRVHSRPTTSPSVGLVRLPLTHSQELIQDFIRKEVSRALRSGSEVTLMQEPPFESESTFQFLKNLSEIDQILDIEKRIQRVEEKYQMVLTAVQMHLNQRAEEVSKSASCLEISCDHEEDSECDRKPWMIEALDPAFHQVFPSLQFCPPSQTYLMRDLGHQKRLSSTLLRNSSS